MGATASHAVGGRGLEERRIPGFATGLEECALSSQLALCGGEEWPA